MYIGIVGDPGAGKSLFLVIFSHYLSSLFHVPINSAQITIKGVHRIKTRLELQSISDCILVVDEMPDLLDSRAFKNNVELTRWVNKLRKRNVILVYTAQDFADVDIRLRNRTQTLIVANKTQEGSFKYVVNQLHRSAVKPRYYNFRGLEDFYQMYDTREYTDGLI